MEIRGKGNFALCNVRDGQITFAGSFKGRTVIHRLPKEAKFACINNLKGDIKNQKLKKEEDPEKSQEIRKKSNLTEPIGNLSIKEIKAYLTSLPKDLFWRQHSIIWRFNSCFYFHLPHFIFWALLLIELFFNHAFFSYAIIMFLYIFASFISIHNWHINIQKNNIVK